MRKWQTRLGAFVLSVAMIFSCAGEGLHASAVAVYETIRAASAVKQATDGTEIQSLIFEKEKNPGLQGDFVYNMQGKGAEVDLVLPNGVDISKLVVTFTMTGLRIMANGKEVISGETVLDFTYPLELHVISDTGKVAAYKLSARALETGLPSVSVFTNNMAPIESKEEYIPGRASISGGTVDYATDLEEGSMKIRGRGNTSWGMVEKRPFRMKFDKKTEVLGMGKAKDWVLIANQSDKSLLRNYAAYELNRRLNNTTFYAKMKPVDFFLNGEYKGQYLIGDQMEVQKNRIDITELDPPNASIDTGYFLEINSRAYIEGDGELGVDMFMTKKAGRVLEYKSPDGDEISQEQRDYIEDYFNQMEAALESGDDYEKYLDVDSAIDWFLVNEIFRNTDSLLDLSTYFYKDGVDDVVHFGPVWDFDISCANTNYEGRDDLRDPEGWYTKNGIYFQWLFRRPEVWARVVNRWNEMKDTQIFTLTDFIRDAADMIRPSAEENFKVQKILGNTVWPNPEELIKINTFDGQVAYLCAYLEKRMAWMDKEINGTSTAVQSVSLGKDFRMEEKDVTYLYPQFSPLNATITNVGWNISGNNVLSMVNGVLTANQVGEATITAEANGKTASCTVRVVNTKALRNLIDLAKHVSPYDYTADSFTKLQETMQACQNVLDDQTADQQTINKVYQELVGAYEGLKDIKTRVESVSLDRDTLKLEVDTPTQLTASVQPADATDPTVSWSVDNPEIATVNNGKVTGVSAGEATISVETIDGGKQASCVVEVINKKPLRNILNEFANVSSELYTKDSYDRFIAARVHALGVLNDPDVDQETLDLEFDTLLSAYQSLEDKEFARQEGWITQGNNRYFYVNGSPATGWKLLTDKWYYFDSQGVMKTGWQLVGNKWYLLDSTGVMKIGWVKVGGKWYYLEGSGMMKTGWAKVGNKWYYLDGAGVMKTGWQKVGGKWYYFDGAGAMKTGWVKVGSKWYYLDGSGAMKTGWQKVGSKWYYLNGSGAMKTGWTKVGSKWYYLNGSGVMQTGWAKVNGKWYFMNSSGAMKTGWQKIGGRWYWFDGNGKMTASTTKKIGRKTYRFNASGICVNP